MIVYLVPFVIFSVCHSLLCSLLSLPGSDFNLLLFLLFFTYIPVKSCCALCVYFEKFSSCGVGRAGTVTHIGGHFNSANATWNKWNNASAGKIMACIRVSQVKLTSSPHPHSCIFKCHCGKNPRSL